MSNFRTRIIVPLSYSKTDRPTDRSSAFTRCYFCYEAPFPNGLHCFPIGRWGLAARSDWPVGRPAERSNWWQGQGQGHSLRPAKRRQNTATIFARKVTVAYLTTVPSWQRFPQRQSAFRRISASAASPGVESYSKSQSQTNTVVKQIPLPSQSNEAR